MSNKNCDRTVRTLISNPLLFIKIMKKGDKGFLSVLVASKVRKNEIR